MEAKTGRDAPRPAARVLLLASGLLAGCAGMSMTDEEIPEVIDQAAWEGRFETTAAPDLDPADDIVEVRLEARAADVEIAEGRRVRMWTYNGLLPGPCIEARAGNTVRVRFKNSLPEATTIHWHGLRVPNAMDGVPVVQSPIAPGAEFTYEFVVPDAGTFWYHPHVRSDEQVERGLHGCIVVRGDDEPATTSDRVVVLDDLFVDSATWQLAPFGGMMQGMLGRQGNVILANGRAHPIADVRPGGLHRFRFINVANARYFRLALPGKQLVQIGTDGGLLESPRVVDEILLVPGERADVLVVADGAPGSAFEWTCRTYDRGEGTGMLPDATVFRMRHTTEAPVATPPLPAVLASVAEPCVATRNREVTLEESMEGAGGKMGPVFSINGYVYPDTVPLEGRVGDCEEWSIANNTPMDHPFHLHGYRFQMTGVGGVAPGFRAWRDTINVPANQTVSFRVRFEEHAGTWLFHCHILEHAERGMVGELRVEDE